MLKFLSKTINDGTNNVFNLGSFVFGITGVIICLVVVVAPYKILEVMSGESIKFIGLNIEKNGALGLLLTSGVIVAAITQPLIGSISDRLNLRIGKRLPFILISGITKCQKPLQKNQQTMNTSKQNLHMKSPD